MATGIEALFAKKGWTPVVTGSGGIGVRTMKAGALPSDQGYISLETARTLMKPGDTPSDLMRESVPAVGGQPITQVQQAGLFPGLDEYLKRLLPSIGITEMPTEISSAALPVAVGGGGLLPAVLGAGKSLLPVAAGAAGAALLGGMVGGGGGGEYTLQSGLPFTPQEGFLGIGVAEPPQAMVAKHWVILTHANDIGNYYIYFWKLIDGRITMYNPRLQEWKIWRPKKNIVISSDPRISMINKLERTYNKVIRKLAKKSKALKLAR